MRGPIEYLFDRNSIADDQPRFAEALPTISQVELGGVRKAGKMVASLGTTFGTIAAANVTSGFQEAPLLSDDPNTLLKVTETTFNAVQWGTAAATSVLAVEGITIWYRANKQYRKKDKDDKGGKSVLEFSPEFLTPGI
jgi:hypothetical protein